MGIKGKKYYKSWKSKQKPNFSWNSENWNVRGFFDNVAAALIKISWSICLYEWSHATSWELSQTKINTEQTGSL